MRLSRVLAGIVGVTVAVAALSGIGAAPAQAADGIEFSTDGTTWSSAPPAALFATGTTLAPGGSVSTTLWVRQTHGVPEYLAVVLRGVQVSSPALAAVATLSAAEGTRGSLGPTTLATLGSCTPLAPAGAVASGVARSITLTLSLPATADASAADGSMIFDVAALATDPAAAPTEDGCGPVAASRFAADATLAATGTSLEALGVAAGLGALGVLLTIIAGWRRRRSARDREG